jgi:hypothetical protein
MVSKCFVHVRKSPARELVLMSAGTPKADIITSVKYADRAACHRPHSPQPATAHLAICDVLVRNELSGVRLMEIKVRQTPFTYEEKTGAAAGMLTEPADAGAYGIPPRGERRMGHPHALP